MGRAGKETGWAVIDEVMGDGGAQVILPSPYNFRDHQSTLG